MTLVRCCRAVIFDLDGVLLDTEPLYTQATQQVLSTYGKQYTWELKVQMMGRDSRSTAELLVAALGLPLSAEQYIARRRPLLEQACRQAPALPGAEKLVRSLWGRGIPMALATSGEASLTRAKAERHAWFELFSAVLCGDDPRLCHPKPAPDIFLLAAQELGVPLEHCVVFEDSLAGVQAAQAANMQVIAVAAPQMDRSRYADGIPIVSSLNDVRLAMLGL
ncbi:MAG: HAD-IA family hydrolase [Polyangiaceae bacterium]|nr:HAD-IA family hydrolase [Polyangiaceae bacterium]